VNLSVVDLSPVPEDGTATEAYQNTVEAARQAEELGYSRFWVAEHHAMADRIVFTIAISISSWAFSFSA